MTKSIIQGLRDYFLDCELMAEGRINVDYLPDSTDNGMEYSIDTVPTEDIIKRYVNDDTIRQYLFVIRSVADYGSDTLQNISNSGFFENLSDWVETQNDNENFPNVGENKTVRSISVQSTGYLFTVSPNVGKYQIQCRLVYEQKGS